MDITNTNASALIGNIAELGKQFGILAGQTTFAIAGIQNLNSGLGAVPDTVQRMVGTVPGIGQLGAGSLGVYNGMNTANEELAKFGANTSALGTGVMMGQTGQSDAELAEMARNMPGGIQAAPRMGERLEVASKVMEAGREDPLARQQTGNMLQFNKALQLATINLLKYGDSNIKSADDIKRLGRQAAEEATRMVDQAQVTGQSIEAIAKETQERLSSAKNTAFMNTLSGQQRDQFGKTISQLQRFGPQVQGLAEKFASGGRIDATDRKTIAALNVAGQGAGSDLQRATQLAMRAGNDPVKIAEANRAMDAFMAKFNDPQTQKGLFNIANRVADEGMKAAANQLLEKQVSSSQGLIAQQQRMGPGATITDAGLEIKRAQDLERTGRVGADSASAREQGLAVGDIDPRIGINKAYNSSISEMQKNTGAAVGAFDSLARKLYTANEQAIDFSETLKTVFGTGTVTERAKKMTDAGTDFIGVLGGTTTPGSATPASAATIDANAPPGYTPGQEDIFGVSRNKGSLGMTGKLFEDFGAGTKILAHGLETIMTQQQLRDFTKFARNYKDDEQLNPDSIISAFESNKSSIDSLAAKTNQKSNMPDISSIMSGMRESLPSPETKSEKMPAFNMPFDDLATGMKDKFEGMSNFNMPFDDLASGMKDKFAQFSKMNFPKPDFDEIKGPEFNKLPILSDLIPEEFSKSERATAQPQSNEPLPKSAGIPTDINPTNMGHVFDQLNRTMGQMASGMGQLVNISHSIKDSNGKIAKHSSKLTGARKAG